MALDIRPITEDDHEQLKALLVEAFGSTSEPWDRLDRPEQTRWGAFVDGTLAATILHRELASWFRGARVPTAGVTGVAVGTEFRGQRLLDPLMDELVRHARSRGDQIATLFASASAIYRGRGFARVLQIANVEFPLASLARVRGSLPMRRAGADDGPLLDEVYRQWACRHDGPLTREGEAFDMTKRFHGATGVTIIEGDDGPRGYLSWKRGSAGPWEESVVAVRELVALDAEAAQTALGAIASFDSVASRVRLFSPGDVDPIRWLLPQNAWTVVDSEPYMLRVLDPTGLSAVPAPPDVEATLPFRLGGEGWVVHVHDGTIEVEHDGGAHGRVMAPGALAVTFAGALPSSAQRAVGLIAGDARDDARWDTVFGGGRQLAIWDSF